MTGPTQENLDTVYLFLVIQNFPWKRNRVSPGDEKKEIKMIRFLQVEDYDVHEIADNFIVLENEGQR